MAKEQKEKIKNKRLQERRKKIPAEVTDRVERSFNNIDRVNIILTDIAENGLSLRMALLNNQMGSATFYKIIDEYPDLQKQYARACDERADLIADQILEIADKQDADVYINADGIELTDHNVINRSRLQVDSRKWLLSKLNPKKYGDKLDLNAGVKIEGEVQIKFDID